MVGEEYGAFPLVSRQPLSAGVLRLRSVGNALPRRDQLSRG